jgi:hypothetical protein
VLKHTHFCRQHLVPLFVKQISQLFRKLYFRIHDPLCFARLSVPLVEPHSAKFSCTQPCQQFLPIQRTLFQPPGLSYCLNMVAGRAGGAGGGGGGGGFGFNTYLFTAGPAQIYTSQPFSLHCNKKFIHAAGGHHGSRQNIRPYRTLRPDPC